VSKSTFYVFILATPKSMTAGFHVGVSPDVPRSLAVREMSDHLGRLVYVERFDTPADACRRERQIRSWRVSRKVALIESRNPAWLDLPAPAA
jgi:predicted GIY-YIG superfamily endonuclease